ncbi:MAG: hypothetical protein GAK35_01274 [Herbaspirillum frisingense]|uniref:Uncharacterized protein n=1 Tax=Herbaspirillum frisingense TaxID=92645 RepID=A0A7V8FYC8_9BURK|nr:MAG: hypothetical protein GAK35_01274 [Herbaspirillum frisingense]
MSCDANRLRQNTTPYQANFSAEIIGDRVTLHRKNKVAEEVLSGSVVNENLALSGMGYRFGQPNSGWMFKFTGFFTGNAKIYTANGEMTTKAGRTARVCNIVMIHTDVAPPPVKDDAGEAQAQTPPQPQMQPQAQAQPPAAK